jgi:hypothetical protein
LEKRFVHPFIDTLMRPPQKPHPPKSYSPFCVAGKKDSFVFCI